MIFELTPALDRCMHYIAVITSFIHTVQSNIGIHQYECIALYKASGNLKDGFWAESVAFHSPMSNRDRSSVMLLLLGLVTIKIILIVNFFKIND